MPTSKNAEWPKVKFGDVVRKVNNKLDPETSGLERYIAGEHMDTDNLRIYRWGTIGDGYLGPAFTSHFLPGQVLYGSRRTYLRKVAVPDFEGICANTTFVLEPSSPELLQEFLPHVMSAESFHEFSIAKSKGSVNPYINYSDLVDYEFVLPPVTDQEQVCKTLNALDFVVESYTSTASSTADLIRSLSVNELEKSGAETLPFSALANIERGVSYKSSDYTEDGVGRPFLTLKSVTRDGRYSPSGIKWVRDSFALKNRVEPGDLFFANTDLTPGRLLVGSPFFLSDEEGLADACFSMDLSRVNATDPRVTNEYIYFALNLPRVRQVMRNLTGGSTVGHLRLSGVSEIEIPVLAESEMRTFICQMRSVKTLQRNLDDHLAKLRIVRSSVLQSLIGGGDHV